MSGEAAGALAAGVDAGAAAAVAAPAAGAAAAVFDPPVSAFVPPSPAPPSELDAGFTDPYPSAYQPPPFIENAGAEITRFSSPPQCGQTVISRSENF